LDDEQLRLDLEDLYARATNVAKYKGLKEEAEDFAQWLMVKYLEGKSQHQTIDQAFIDYRRQQHGDPRTSDYAERKMAETRYIPLEGDGYGYGYGNGYGYGYGNGYGDGYGYGYGNGY
jgi:hypothetical protein